ncbi:MAG TPA: NAD(P)H-hydrate dehydratase [Actinomycetota bacterium]|nr:NAD(P)H-hydrate dehydratase [Actinomycetota bacterium]
MLPVLTAGETRALDEATEARGTPVALLMERAGLAVARATVGIAGGAYGRRAVVMCGKGNNGGDGLVAARHLARLGMAVEVFLLDEELREPAAANLVALRRAGVPAGPFDQATVRRSLGRADVAIDAIFGIGFRGAAEGAFAAAIGALNDAPAPVVAVDIPSGVEGDTGALRGAAVSADVTVTFGAPKVGTMLFPGAELVGTLEVADIGFPQELLVSEAWRVEADDVRAWWPVRDPDTSKRRSGVVMVIGGSRRMTGAPRLMAEAALRAGAGLVTVAVPEGILAPVQAGLLEPTFVPLAEGSTGSLSEAAWDVVADRLQGFDAVAIGPGLSTEGETPSFVRRLVREASNSLVIDADAINAFAGRAGDLSQHRGQALITPHVGEFARLFGMPAEEVAEDRIGFCRKAAAETGCVVLLKGSRSVVASPDGEVRINPTGGRFLATGGTGDVLSGLIAALLARGLSAVDAASAAAFVHGVAGWLAGGRTGEGTVAGDVARALPEAILRITEGR